MVKGILGRRIREERLRLHLTQEALAEEVDLTTAYIGQVERGEKNLTLENVVKVANRLGVSVDYLLSDSLEVEHDKSVIELSQLLNGRTLVEKHMVVDVVKIMTEYMERSNESADAVSK